VGSNKALKEVTPHLKKIKKVCRATVGGKGQENHVLREAT
jgi:hypothetical protein